MIRRLIPSLRCHKLIDNFSPECRKARIGEACGRQHDAPWDAQRSTPPEAAVAEIANVSAVEACLAEGLSTDQYLCIVAARTFWEFFALAECQALGENRPTGLTLPGALPEPTPDWFALTPEEMNRTLGEEPRDLTTP